MDPKLETRTVSEAEALAIIEARRGHDPWRENELANQRRLREDGKRSLGENLSEGLELCEFLGTFTGILKR